FPVSVRHPIEADAAVEDATRLDPPLENVGQQLLDVGAYRSRSAADRHVLEECLLRARDRVVVRDADTADRAAWTRDLDRGEGRVACADALENRVSTMASGEFPHALDG